MANSQEPSEAQELELLERVFLRIGCAESDEQLEKTLNTFLPPTINKLTSRHESVQNKVVELLTHVNRRLRNRPAIQLPMVPLLDQFCPPATPPPVANFSLIYIKLGFPRLSPTDQTHLLPKLLLSLEGKTTQQTESVLQLCVPSLVHLKLPKTVSDRKALFSLDSHPSVQTSLLQFLLCYLLLPYGSLDVQAPPGMSMNQVAMVTGGTFLAPDKLEKVKLTLLRFLSSEIFSADDVIAHLLVAAGDPRHSVSDLADSLLKQFSGSVDWESSAVISTLFRIYQGSVATPGKRGRSQSTPPSDPKSHQAPAGLRVRLRLLPTLLKSTRAANSFPECVQVVFDSLFGILTNAKLRMLALELVMHICSKAVDPKLAVMGPVLLTGLNKIVDLPIEEAKLRVMAYSGISSLAKRTPALFKNDTKHLTKLFVTLERKNLESDIGLAVQECLGVMMPAYRGLKGQHSLIVEALLLEKIHSSSTKARLAAAHYATSVFPFSHLPSRFVSMLACGDSKDEVREEGRRGLRLPKKEDIEEEKKEEETESPDFVEMLQYFHRRASLVMEGGVGYSTAAGSLPFSPPTLTAAFLFLRLCLSHSAGVTQEQRVRDQTLVPIAEYLRRLLAGEGGEKGTKCMPQYLELLKQALGPAADAHLQSVAMEALLECTVSCPAPIIFQLSQDIQWIRGFTHSSLAETRESSGRLLGFLAGFLEEKQFASLVDQLLQETRSNTYSSQHGAVIALGYVTAEGLRSLGSGCHDNSAMDVDDSGRVGLVRKSLRRLVSMMSLSTTVQLTGSVCTAIGEVCRSGPLPLPDSSDKEGEKEEEVSKATIVKTLAAKLKASKDRKLKEHCAHALGYIVVGDPQFADKQSVLQALFEMREEKAIDVHFSVGEAISCITAGRISSASHDPWRLPSNDEESTAVDRDIMPWALEHILSQYACGPLAMVRQAACVWLLCLLKHAGQHPDVQPFLKQIQMIFINMLAETNDVTQEVASRGLGLVYELSNHDDQKEVVELLLGTLMEGRKSGVEVTGSTKVFQSSLGKVPEGGKLSTYKELCSLASDLNQPDLIYKFMHLANHHALWNSKKGAAFGFSSIASKAQEQLAPHLPTLIPRLYRYKYDPNLHIQLAMTSIWSAVIPESKKAVDKYYDVIIKDLMENLNSGLWRSREASCLALSDLLVGRQAGEVVEHLPQLWLLCLRVRDDIKESVRIAAHVACRSLYRVTARACDSSTMEKTGALVVEGVLPLLLDKGMTNPSDEVRAISLLSILKIAKNAGPLLKPHVPVLVATLLESLSSLEPQALNTLSLKLSGETEIQEKLDNIRVASSRSTPMMEAVNLCVPHVDSDVLTTLVPRVIEILKSGVGTSTKVSTAQFVVSLTLHCLHDLTPHCGKLLNALMSGLLDRSVAVRKANARAIGHLAKIAKDTSMTRVVEKMKKWYFEKEDADTKAIIAIVFQAISTHSPDRASAMATDILPIVFLAMHAKPNEEDPGSEASVKVWGEVWEEMVTGTESAVRMYLTELVGVASPALGSQSWHIKALGAAAMATIAEKMGSALGPPHLSTILSSLVSGLHGRTWSGKESLLKAVGTVAVSCKSAILAQQDPDLPSVEKLTQTLLQQCKKKDSTYRAIAIETTGEAVEALGVDVFEELSDILLPLIDPVSHSVHSLGSMAAVSSMAAHTVNAMAASVTEAGGKGDDDDEGEEEEGGRRSRAGRQLVLQTKSFDALGRAWPADNPATQAACYARVCRVLSESLRVNTWQAQVAIFSALRNIFSRLAIELSSTDVESLISQTLPTLCKCLRNTKLSPVRHSGLLCLDKITAYLQDHTLLGSLPPDLTADITSTLSSLTSSPHTLSSASTNHGDRQLAQRITERLGN